MVSFRRHKYFPSTGLLGLELLIRSQPDAWLKRISTVVGISLRKNTVELDEKFRTFARHGINPITPPISSVKVLHSANPNPVPSYSRVVEPSACENTSNTFACSLRRIPIPVSMTDHRTRLESGDCSNIEPNTSPSRSELQRVREEVKDNFFQAVNIYRR